MEKEIYVIKRDDSKEIFNVEKINKVLGWAINGYSGVSLSDLEINIKLNIKDGIKTKEIHKVLIETAANLISLENPNYQFVAARLINYGLRKEVWGGKNPPRLLDFLRQGIERGYYDGSILNKYTEQEINKIGEFIDHDRDFLFTYAGIKQLCDKYLIQNRKTKQIFETPNLAYLLISLYLFQNYEGEKRMIYIKRSYNYFSKHKINLATPIMGGMRGVVNSYSSCMLVDMDDTKESINATNTAVSMATASRYGIGVNFGRMRSLGTEIRGGETVHPGVIPFLKIVESNVKAWQQSGLRGGSATVTFPIWHLQIEDIIELKDVGGTHDVRVFNLDYSISISKIFYERFIKNQDITLFSPHEVKDLYEAYGLPHFDELYLKYENDKSIKYKKTVSARDLFVSLTKQRLEAGRIYIYNIDNANNHVSWDPEICKSLKFSNLCQEVVTPTIPMSSFEDPDASIGICILSAVNWLEINSEQELEKVCDVIVRLLDELIDIQKYFNTAARNFATLKRSLGIGIINLAAFLAKNGTLYGEEESIRLCHERMEKQQYYLLKAGVELAKEKGVAPHFHNCRYSKGILPIDTYKKDIDDFCKVPLLKDWESLRQDILKYGLRNCTYSCAMPSESSSVISNATNGIEPIRSFITYKVSKASTVPILAPGFNKWIYDLAFNKKDNEGYLKIAAILQKFIDMAISVNLYYSPNHYPDKKIPYSQILQDTLKHYKWGGHTIYYVNTDDQNIHFEESKHCSGDSCVL